MFTTTWTCLLLTTICLLQHGHVYYSLFTTVFLLQYVWNCAAGRASEMSLLNVLTFPEASEESSRAVPREGAIVRLHK